MLHSTLRATHHRASSDSSTSYQSISPTRRDPDSPLSSADSPDCIAPKILSLQQTLFATNGPNTNNKAIPTFALNGQGLRSNNQTSTSSAFTVTSSLAPNVHRSRNPLKWNSRRKSADQIAIHEQSTSPFLATPPVKSSWRHIIANTLSRSSTPVSGLTDSEDEIPRPRKDSIGKDSKLSRSAAPRSETPLNTLNAQNILTEDSETIAEQMFTRDAILFASITFPEKTQQMTLSFNQKATWTTHTILQCVQPKQRIIVLSWFITLAQHCLERKNLHACKAVVTGMLANPVFRLERTWALLPRRDRHVFDKLEAIMTPNNNSAPYREYLATVEGPCIPYLGVPLSDLVYLKTLAPTPKSRQQIHELVSGIKAYQKMLPPLVIGDLMSKYFVEEPVTITENELYQLSYAIEQRKVVGAEVTPSPVLDEDDGQYKRSTSGGRRLTDLETKKANGHRRNRSLGDALRTLGGLSTSKEHVEVNEEGGVSVNK